MGKITNSYVLGEIVKSLFHVAGRRTTQGFAAKVIGSIIKTLEQKYDFLKYVEIAEVGEFTGDEAIVISEEIDNIDRELVGKAIEAIIRIAYMDIIGKAGLFFIAEIKRRAGNELMNDLQLYGVDLAALQVEQHYLYRIRERKKRKTGKGRGAASDVSLLGYSWSNVASWKFDPTQNTCILYNKEGEVLDNLHLESTIENYVNNLSEELGVIPEDLEKSFEMSDKELELLHMLHSRDMDAEAAMTLLYINKSEFNIMVKKLLKNELLQYTSYNVIELTEIGLSCITKKDAEEKTENEILSE